MYKSFQWEENSDAFRNLCIDNSVRSLALITVHFVFESVDLFQLYFVYNYSYEVLVLVYAFYHPLHLNLLFSSSFIFRYFMFILFFVLFAFSTILPFIHGHIFSGLVTRYVGVLKNKYSLKR